MTVTERAPLNRALIAETALSLIDESLVETSFSMLSLGAWHSLCRVVLLILVLTTRL